VENLQDSLFYLLTKRAVHRPSRICSGVKKRSDIEDGLKGMQLPENKAARVTQMSERLVLALFRHRELDRTWRQVGSGEQVLQACTKEHWVRGTASRASSPRPQLPPKPAIALILYIGGPRKP
jgi:hypothetical protein